MPSDMDEAYAEYLGSDDKSFEAGGHTYWRIISRDWARELRPGTPMLIVTVDSRIGGRDGDWYEDEAGRSFGPSSVALLSFRSAPPPEWYCKTVTLGFPGFADEIGGYLRWAGSGDSHGRG